MAERAGNERQTRRTLLGRTAILAAGAGVGAGGVWGYATVLAGTTDRGFDTVVLEADAGRVRGADGVWLSTFGFPAGWRVLPGDLVFVGPDPDDGADPDVVYAQPRIRWGSVLLPAGASVGAGSTLGANDEFAVVPATDFDPGLGYLADAPVDSPVLLNVGFSDGTSQPRPILAVRAA